MANITYNGVNSEEFGLVLTNDVEHELASNDIETVDVLGRDGVLLVDNQRLKPVERAYPFVLKNDVYKATTDISGWLGAKGWKDLKLSWDPEYMYKATVINNISIQEVIKQFGRLRVAFLVYPIKYIDNFNPITLTNGQTVMNKGNVIAKPKITIEGSGDTVITINGRRTVLENVQGSLILDMNRNLIYRDEYTEVSDWDKLVREEDSTKPYLDVGENTINWTNNFTVSIITYEGVKL